MTFIRPAAGDGSSSEFLTEAREHYLRAARVFEALILKIEAGDGVSPGDSEKAARELSRAKQTFFDERKKIEDQLCREAGVHRDYAIDFGAARDEIRRRMACLRAAGEGRGLSE